MPSVPPQTLPTTKSINKIKTYGECDAFATGLAIAFAYKGRANAKKNAFAQRAGISKHITAVNYKTYKCKITNFIAQNNKLQVKNNNLQE